MQVTKESETNPGYCQCGHPLHYSKRSSRQLVDRMIDLAEDPFVTVKFSGVSYRVQRHFIALHGFSLRIAQDYGFEIC
jgi:hypothetical protein